MRSMTSNSSHHHGAHPEDDQREAFLRVRVSDDVTPSGYVGVYLATGTRLTVAARDLLHLDRVDGRLDESPASRRGADHGGSPANSPRIDGCEPREPGTSTEDER